MSFVTAQGKGKFTCLWERENWISKAQPAQSEMLSCGGDEELSLSTSNRLALTVTRAAGERYSLSCLLSLVWVDYILTFSIGNMLPHPSLQPTCCSVCSVCSFIINIYPSLVSQPVSEGKRQEILFHFSLKRNLYLKWPDLTTVGFDREYWGRPMVPNLPPETGRSNNLEMVQSWPVSSEKTRG